MNENASAEPRRLVAYFSGNVQGVGFRFTVIDLAETMPEVSGTVANLRDGRVELIAEGPDASLEHLLQAVSQRMGGYISDTQIRYEPATGEFRGFSISR